MQDTLARIGQPTLSQRLSTWSNTETALLRRLASERLTAAHIKEQFPDRTVSAVRVKLCAIRRELGIPKRCPLKNLVSFDSEPKMLDPADPGLRDEWLPAWAKRAQQSNLEYLAALQRAA